MSTDIVAASKELLKVQRQLVKVRAILEQLEKKRAELLAALGG
jgi:uncharacterized protein YydD (DUF2326 family)